jgi:hypothetical protein
MPLKIPHGLFDRKLLFQLEDVSRDALSSRR